MKRKTNLFYKTGPDSKFLTFSNYTESLTGNFLSTEHKLFPSKFLCLNIENLNDNTKSSFIDILVEYYENKLAVTRDNMNENENAETYILPLAYLIECLCHMKYENDRFIYKQNADDVYNIKTYNGKDVLCYKENTETPHPLDFIKYIGDITEQDYDGTYTDTICIVDLDNFYKGIICANNDLSAIKSVTHTKEDQNILHGWNRSIDEETQEVYTDLPEDYQDAKPIFDQASTEGEYGQYNFKSIVSSIDYEALDDKSELTFNILIPLFDLTNINYSSNESNIVNDQFINCQSDINYNAYNYNVPLGMWISTEPITLKRDTDTMLSPTWSLLVTSQFKALPYYSKNLYPNNSEAMSNFTPIEISQSKQFNTFASIVVRQNQLIEEFTKMFNQVNELNHRLDIIDSKLNNIGSITNIDSLHIECANFESDMNNKFESFKDDIKEIIKNLAWKASI